MSSLQEPDAPDAHARVERRLRRAGQRYRSTDGERAAALAELKAAIGEADGHFSAHRAAELTGLPSDLLKAMQPDLTAPEIPPPG
jgi:hypothetical protein